MQHQGKVGEGIVHPHAKLASQVSAGWTCNIAGVYASKAWQLQTLAHMHAGQPLGAQGQSGAEGTFCPTAEVWAIPACCLLSRASRPSGVYASEACQLQTLDQ